MKKLSLPIIILLLLTNIFTIYLFVFKGDVAKTIDNRTAIKLSAANDAFAKEEMRGFLESVQEIHLGITNNNAQQVTAAGKKSGGFVIDHAPKGMMKALPVGFKKLGFATHDLFDEIAKSAETNFDPKVTQEQVNRLLVNCVSCHRAFKLQIVE
jgi:hypothetical protein